MTDAIILPYAHIFSSFIVFYITFSGCPSICACVTGRRHSLHGLPSTSSYINCEQSDSARALYWPNVADDVPIAVNRRHSKPDFVLGIISTSRQFLLLQVSLLPFFFFTLCCCRLSVLICWHWLQCASSLRSTNVPCALQSVLVLLWTPSDLKPLTK